MRFSYAPSVQERFPGRVSQVVFVEGIHPSADVSQHTARFCARAKKRLDEQPEGVFPEIKAWRHAFAQMGLKPTQYRCASEALLRRFRKDGCLPLIHPLVDLCNAASIASAIPIAVFDADKVSDELLVRHAKGSESYLAFGGTLETPEPGEVIFVDADNAVHARRWTNRQSRLSAVTPTTKAALIVAEALHETAREDIQSLKHDLGMVWAASPAIRTSESTLRGHETIFDSDKQQSDINVV